MRYKRVGIDVCNYSAHEVENDLIQSGYAALRPSVKIHLDAAARDILLLDSLIRMPYIGGAPGFGPNS